MFSVVTPKRRCRLQVRVSLNLNKNSPADFSVLTPRSELWHESEKTGFCVCNFKRILAYRDKKGFAKLLTALGIDKNLYRIGRRENFILSSQLYRGKNKNLYFFKGRLQTKHSPWVISTYSCSSGVHFPSDDLPICSLTYHNNKLNVYKYDLKNSRCHITLIII